MSQYDFFKNIKLDEDGNVIVVIVDDSGNTLTNTKSQYDFFKKVELTPEGYLKITIK